MENENSDIKKMPALNWRFGASGGVARPSVCAYFRVSALVRAAVKPPPAPSRSNVRRQRATVLYTPFDLHWRQRGKTLAKPLELETMTSYKVR